MSIIFWLVSAIHICLVSGILENSTQWVNAYRKCTSRGEILTPVTAIKLTNDMYQSQTAIWTPNFFINVGCLKDTGIYVEKLPITNVFNGLCINNTDIIEIEPLTYKNISFLCSWDHPVTGSHPNSLLNITDSTMLEKAVNVMRLNVKYWVIDINPDLCSIGRQCEVYTPSANTKSQFTNTCCNSLHGFTCDDGKAYKTVISLVRTTNSERRSSETEPKNTFQTDGIIFFGNSLLQLITMGIVGVVLFVVILLFCLLKQWISRLQREILKLQHQGYTQPMYQTDLVQVIQESVPEPETPLTPSIYENGAAPFGTDMTISNLASKQYRRAVPVTELPDHSHSGDVQDNSPTEQRLASQENIPKHSSLEYLPMDRMTRIDIPQTSTEPAAETLYHNPKAIVTGADQCHQQHNSANLAEVEPAYNYEDAITKIYSTPIKNNESVTTKEYRRQLSQTTSEYTAYINTTQNTQLGNPEADDQAVDYENIWQKTL